MISVGKVMDPWVHNELFSSTVRGQDMSHESWVLCYQMFRRVSITGSWISKLFGIFTVETFNFGMYPYTAEATPIYAATAQGRQGSFWAVQELPVHFLSCHVEWKCFMQESRTEFFETLSQHFFLSTFALVVSGSITKLEVIRQDIWPSSGECLGTHGRCPKRRKQRQHDHQCPNSPR